MGTGWRKTTIATFGAEDRMQRKAGTMLSNSVKVRPATWCRSPQRFSMTTSLRRKREKVSLQSGLVDPIKKRRVFGSGWTAALSEITDSQRGLTISPAMARINSVWSSGQESGMTIFAQRRTILSAVRDCAQVHEVIPAAMRHNLTSRILLAAT